MPRSLDPCLWPLLAGRHDQRLTRADWAILLGESAMATVPLSIVQGISAEFVRCPRTGIPLEVHENRDGSFSALAPRDSALDSRINGLTLIDLQVYEIDWPQLLGTVQCNLKLTGRLRCLSFTPLLWQLGMGSARPYYFANLRSIGDMNEILRSSNPNPAAD